MSFFQQNNLQNQTKYIWGCICSGFVFTGAIVLSVAAVAITAYAAVHNSTFVKADYNPTQVELANIRLLSATLEFKNVKNLDGTNMFKNEEISQFTTIPLKDIEMLVTLDDFELYKNSNKEDFVEEMAQFIFHKSQGKEFHQFTENKFINETLFNKLPTLTLDRISA